MDSREYLVKAQEAEALADVAMSPVLRKNWESVAVEYREMAQQAAGAGNTYPSDPGLTVRRSPTEIAVGQNRDKTK